MFRELDAHGGEAVVTWSYHTAAVCRTWTIHKTEQGRWSLEATVLRADPLYLRFRPLIFSVPRNGGRWCWPMRAVSLMGTTLTAALGPMEA